MPSYLDLAVIGIVLLSALLSMVRGFTREVLAIASWAAAAVAAYFFYPQVMPFLEPYITKDQVRQIAAIAIVFFVVLILVSIITVRLSDAILDSKVGALDRTLGFVFGAARGFLLAVVAFMFFNWLVPKTQPEWVNNAKLRPLLQTTGDELIAFLPPDAENAILKRFHKLTPGEETPASEEPEAKPATPVTPLPPQRRTDAAPAAKPSEASATDKQKLDALLGRSSATAPKP